MFINSVRFMGYSCGYISLKKGIRTAYVDYATQEKIEKRNMYPSACTKMQHKNSENKIKTHLSGT